MGNTCCEQAPPTTGTLDMGDAMTSEAIRGPPGPAVVVDVAANKEAGMGVRPAAPPEKTPEKTVPAPPAQTSVSPATGAPLEPAVAPTEQAERRWEVRLVKENETDMFGLVWVTSKSERNGFPVRAIRKDRVVDLWNRANPQNEIRPGDIILSANGKADAESMKAELQSQRVCVLQMLR
mmetsp:Transcript_2645/g.6215  ORF Transcript_2645/g.6215 Transcript_2645/m.6215 type:complete len:179 (+) Transcript_2645:81-617(+)